MMLNTYWSGGIGGITNMPIPMQGCYQYTGGATMAWVAGDVGGCGGPYNFPGDTSPYARVSDSACQVPANISPSSPYYQDWGYGAAGNRSGGGTDYTCGTEDPSYDLSGFMAVQDRWNYAETGTTSVCSTSVGYTSDCGYPVQFRVFESWEPYNVGSGCSGPASTAGCYYPQGEACSSDSCVSAVNAAPQPGYSNTDSSTLMAICETTTSGCATSNESLAINTWSFRDGVAMDVAKMPTTWWSGGSADQTPCAVQGYQGPSGLDYTGNTYPTLYAGHSYQYTFSGTKNVDDIVVDPWDTSGGPGTAIALGTAAVGWERNLYDGDDLNRTNWPITGLNVDGGDTVHLSPDGVIQGPDSSGTTIITITPTKTGAWDPQFMCVWSGEVFYWGDVTSPPAGSPLLSTPGDCSSGLGVFCASDLTACLNGAGLGLDPSSWVPGLVQDFGCLLQWLFVPASVNTSELTSGFTAHVPGMWVADAFDAVTTFTGSLSGALSGGSACSAPFLGWSSSNLGTLGSGFSGKKLGVTLPTPSSCGGASGGVGDVFGYRTVLRDILVLGVWASVFLICWRMMPWSRRDDGMSIIGDGVAGGMLPAGTVFDNHHDEESVTTL